MGAEPLGDDGWELRGERRGGRSTTTRRPSRGTRAPGTVHHVAWGTTVAEHPRWHERLNEAGVP